MPAGAAAHDRDRAETPAARGAATTGLRLRAAGGGGGREGRPRSQSATAEPPGRGRGAPRREPGAGSRARRAGAGPERSGEGARPAQPRVRRPPSRRGAGPAAAAPAMEQDGSPRKIQFTVPLLEPHLDPEAAEQVRGGGGRGLAQPRTRGPGLWQPRNPLRPPLAGRPREGDRAPFGGLLSPPPPWSHICPSVLGRAPPSKPVRAEGRSLPPQPWGRGPA